MTTPKLKPGTFRLPGWHLSHLAILPHTTHTQTHAHNVHTELYFTYRLALTETLRMYSAELNMLKILPKCFQELPKITTYIMLFQFSPFCLHYAPNVSSKIISEHFNR